MGQYWYVVNLTKRECVNPHKLGAGLKLWEQLAAHPGTGAALIVLCAAMPQRRGGGDLDLDENWHGPEREFPQHSASPGPMPEDYQAVAARTIGRWAGDRIALVGDYAEDTDLPAEFEASKIYDKCQPEEKEIYNNRPKGASHRIAPTCTTNGKPHPHAGKYVHYKVVRPSEFLDISDDVARVIEHELCGKYEGDGWRSFSSKE